MQSDYIAEELGWLDELFTRTSNKKLVRSKKRVAVMEGLITRWRHENRLSLLNDLAARYGEEEVFAVIDQIIEKNLKLDWRITGEEKGNAFERFLELLWVPLLDEGFEYTYEKQGNQTMFCVTRCPVAEAAKRMNAEKWLYHLTCLTDGPSVTGFNDKIVFSRTKTLMQGHACCDHCYTDNSE
jgi:hypothetical protein